MAELVLPLTAHRESVKKMLVIQILLSALFSLTIFSSWTVAAPLPVPEPEAQNLVARSPPPPIPTLEQIKQQLNVPPGESLFYSCDKNNLGSCKQAKEWAKKNHPSLKVLTQLWVNRRYPDTWQADPHVSKNFWDVASQAMAEKSSGTVYVVLGPWKSSDGKDWWAGSVWARKEWPALIANRAVTSVIRVDAATGATIKIK